MKKINVTILSLFLIISSSQFTHAQGYRYDSTAKRVFGPPDMEEYGFAKKKLPVSFSLEAWAPPVMEQVGGTCAGFATAYAAASTLFNIRLNITDELTKHFFAFDPYFFYSLNAVLEADTCEKGMMIQAALVNATNYGFKHALLPPIPSCSQDIAILKKGLALSKPNIPAGVYDLLLEKAHFGDKSKKFIESLKSALAEYYLPIVFGTRCDSLTMVMLEPDSSGLKKAGELWIYDPASNVDDGHAMCVMGYDDQKYGGSFKVMNSWGDQVGDHGYIWIKYTDFYKYADELFVMEMASLNEGPCLMGDCENGYGTTFLADSTFYTGQFKNGLPEGFGISCSSDGVLYAGAFIAGLKDGMGFLGYENEVYEAKFAKGALVRDEEFGFATSGSNQLRDLSKKFESYKKMRPTSEIPEKLY